MIRFCHIFSGRCFYEIREIGPSLSYRGSSGRVMWRHRGEQTTTRTGHKWVTKISDVGGGGEEEMREEELSITIKTTAGRA